MKDNYICFLLHRLQDIRLYSKLIAGLLPNLCARTGQARKLVTWGAWWSLNLCKRATTSRSGKVSFLKQFILDLRIKGTSDHVHVVTPDYFMEIRSVSNLGIKTGWSSYIYPWVVSIVLKQSHGLSMCVNRLDITLRTILLLVAFWNMMGHELQLLHDYWAHIYTHI
jgi:hypothetical protein